MKFAGFVMTFERSLILEETISKIFAQSFSPEKIIIVDNSFSNDTEELIKKLNNPKVIYHKVGYNSGPAGAAKIGLSLLASQGYDWIYWGDDDDPPFFENTFEILLKVAVSDSSCGCVGSVGQFFNRTTGFIKRVPDELLKINPTLTVDNIAGGMSKIVNGKMILKTQIFPDEKLFYGFEELDFDLQIKKAGYSILVDSEHYLKHRLKFNKLGVKKNKYKKKSKVALVREYFSIRNLLYIYYKNNLLSALVIFLVYSFLKQFIRFKDGFSIGFFAFKITFFAIFDFITKRMGFRKINLT